MPSLAQIVGSLLLHQGDAADPELIHWLKDRMDAIIGLEPWVMVVITAGVVMAIPMAIGLLYYYQQRRYGTPQGEVTGPATSGDALVREQEIE